MKLKHLMFGMLFGTLLTALPAGAAVTQLSSLGNPTLQTLISMGSQPVVVGDVEFSNFGFTDNSTGTQLAASQIHVEAYTASGNGLEFIAGWYASGGSTLDDVISYDAQAVDPSKPIGVITLLSNTNAPVPGNGTFTTATLLSQNTNGSSAGPIISNYNNGVTPPAGQTDPNVDFSSADITPVPALFETTTLLGSSGGGGVVSASVLENSYITVPEIDHSSWIVPPLIILMMLMSRPRRTPFP